MNLHEFEIGIGIHTVEAVIGNISSLKHMEFTAIGDLVNTASRLEGLTKQFGWTIVANSNIINAASWDVLTGKEEKIMIKGREGDIKVFKVIGLKSGKGEWS